MIALYFLDMFSVLAGWLYTAVWVGLFWGGLCSNTCVKWGGVVLRWAGFFLRWDVVLSGEVAVYFWPLVAFRF